MKEYVICFYVTTLILAVIFSMTYLTVTKQTPAQNRDASSYEESKFPDLHADDV